MRSVVQRVDRAEIRIARKCISLINKGILVFLGVQKRDEERDADYLSDKIIHLRIFEDDKGKMNRSLLDVNGEMLIVSQFTLLGRLPQGKKAFFH